jgi:hypothetical protein
MLPNSSASVQRSCRHDCSSVLPWLSAIGIFVLLFDSSTVLAQPVTTDAARKEGKVTAYGTIIPQVMEPLHRNLEKNITLSHAGRMRHR